MNNQFKLFATALLATTVLGTNISNAADVVAPDVASSVAEDFDQGRFYVSGFGGFTFAGDTGLNGTVGGANQTVAIDFDNGYTIGAALGYNYGDIGNGSNLRAEVELTYSDQDIDQIFFSGNGPAAEVNVAGDFTTTNLVVNGLVDLPAIGDGSITPYVGGGIGVAFSEIDAVYGPGVRLDNDETNFLAQAIIGASYAATETTDLFVEARYARIFNFETPRFNGAGGLTGVIEDDVDTAGINFGLRVKF